MSRKRKAPKRKHYPDPKYKSLTVSKFINAIMYDGRRSSAERILYTALDKIKNQNINDLKIILANKATEILHGKKASRIAEKTAKDTFEKNVLGSDLPHINIKVSEITITHCAV